MRVAITGTGLFTPPHSITNDELVASFNTWVDAENEKNSAAIASGTQKPLERSSSEFIVKASGIERRYVMDKAGILDPNIMAPRLKERSAEEPSIQCDMSVAAAKTALEQARLAAEDIDALVVACSNMQRPYPAIAVEVQAALGTRGHAFDMNVACSSATFGLAMARDMIVAGTAKKALVISPEICSGHLNFRDRDSHFIFGDACTAMVLEQAEGIRSSDAYEVLGTKLITKFSNAIRNDFGFLNRADPEHQGDANKLFVQQGRKVFKEVSPMVAELIVQHLGSLGIAPAALKRMWLHQANASMNEFIARRVLGREPVASEVPSLLHEYANTSSCGSIITFHANRSGMSSGDLGLICSFGAGYSAGSVVVRKV
ncbi:MAG: beta-ketoacyl-ACP synthase III [Myxococcota bacterium]